MAIEALLKGEGEALTRKAIELAKAGDMQALKLCMDRLAPARRDSPVAFNLPEMKGRCGGRSHADRGVGANEDGPSIRQNY